MGPATRLKPRGLRRFAQGEKRDERSSHARVISNTSTSIASRCSTRGTQAQMLTPHARGLVEGHDPYEAMRGYWDRSSAPHNLLERLLIVDSKTYLHELLMKQDQMSMAASIESRVPFLDHTLVGIRL